MAENLQFKYNGKEYVVLVDKCLETLPCTHPVFCNGKFLETMCAGEIKSMLDELGIKHKHFYDGCEESGYSGLFKDDEEDW